MEKIVLITGGSRGIGRATSMALAQEGYFVCINYRTDVGSAKSLETEIKRDGGKALALQADISNEQQLLELFAQIDTLNGSLWGLVNNAAILAPQSSLSEMTWERMRKTFDTNVIGTFLCSREAVKRMTKNGGSIVNISSGASKSGAPHEYVDYAATKGAIDTFTLGLSKEVAEHHIRVNAIRPGFIATEMHTIPNRLETVKALIPMKRVGQPIEIAKAVVWLLSEDASYTTGAIIDIAGGK